MGPLQGQRGPERYNTLNNQAALATYAICNSYNAFRSAARNGLDLYSQDASIMITTAAKLIRADIRALIQDCERRIRKGQFIFHSIITETCSNGVWDIKVLNTNSFRKRIGFTGEL